MRFLFLIISFLITVVQTGNGTSFFAVASSGSSCTGALGNPVDGVTPHSQAQAFRYFLRKTTFTCSGTASSASAYLINSENNTREVIFVVYNDNANHPGTLHSQGTAAFGIDGGWLDMSSYNGAITPGTYWIGVLKESASTNPYYVDELTTGISFAYQETDFTPDADLTGVGTIEDKDYSFKITFP